MSSDQVPYAQDLVDDLSPHPAYIATVACDLLSWNSPYSAIFGDPGDLPPDSRNWLWSFFTSPVVQTRLCDWHAAVPSVVGQFRSEAGKYPGDVRLNEVISRLEAASEEFRTAWSEHLVQRFTPNEWIVEVDRAGAIRMRQVQLQALDVAGLTLTVYRLRDDDSKARLQEVMDQLGLR